MSSSDETRFWPRVGLYVTRKSAAEFIERMGGTGHSLDEDMEEFVSPGVPDPKSLGNEIDELFTKPYESHDVSTENMAILNLMQFESDKKKFIMEKKGEGMTLDEAKDSYKQTLHQIVFDSLPEDAQDRVRKQIEEKERASEEE
tara:strand:- start:975 stop:1406 length:432 start_codon:yes stop_codon:yes gene_type:complete